MCRSPLWALLVAIRDIVFRVKEDICRQPHHILLWTDSVGEIFHILHAPLPLEPEIVGIRHTVESFCSVRNKLFILDHPIDWFAAHSCLLQELFILRACVTMAFWKYTDNLEGFVTRSVSKYTPRTADNVDDDKKVDFNPFHSALWLISIPLNKERCTLHKI